MPNTLSPNELDELARRCEAAEEPDKFLGREILLACGRGYVSPMFHRDNPTASIDAALTLVPEPGRWGMTADPAHGAVVYVNESNRGEAATPALALCAAALRAQAQEASK